MAHTQKKAPEKASAERRDPVAAQWLVDAAYGSPARFPKTLEGYRRTAAPADLASEIATAPPVGRYVSIELSDLATSVGILQRRLASVSRLDAARLADLFRKRTGAVCAQCGNGVAGAALISAAADQEAGSTEGDHQVSSLVHGACPRCRHGRHYLIWIGD